VALKLEPGWDLKRRTYEERALSHLYFASQTSLPQLIASAGGTAAGQSWRRPLGPDRDELPAVAAADPTLDLGEDAPMARSPGRAIALQVIPYSDSNGGGL